MKQGFSLVELSIVLVILGLLTGGILAGQSLIRASEMRAVSAEYQRYAAAANTFRDKYFGIPGDISSATRFWGRQAATADCVTNSVATVSASGTCDGNNNGTLNDAAAASESGEHAQFWRQLALAGLIEGTYSGYANSGGFVHCVIGTDCPKSKLASAGWSMRGLGFYGGDGQVYAMDYGNTMIVGAAQTGINPVAAVMRPEEAWNIDTKADDGKPAYGKVIARFWNNACAAADDGTHANNDLAASYKLSDSSIQCAIYFRQQF